MSRVLILGIMLQLPTALLVAQETHPPRERSPGRAEAGPASPGIVEPGARLVELGRGFRFTEGPVADRAGRVTFSDVRASRTYTWSPEGGVKLFRENTGGANGLALDRAGNLVVCEGETGRIVRVDARGAVTVLADRYAGKRFNRPNDLWIDPRGGIYFTDPVYGKAERVQGGEHVYYIAPDGKKVTRVIQDMIRPNGLVGTTDGKTLYVADHGAGKTWRYNVKPDGTLRGKTLFTASGSDGMTIDAAGNVYLTTDAVRVYAPSGKLIDRIEVPQRPTNLCFAGPDLKTLFITARTGVYAIKTTIGVKRSPRPSSSDQSPRPRK